MSDPGFSDGAAWIGGRFVPVAEAAIPVTDWGVIHADIAYDVVPVWEGAFFRLDDHLARFEASCARMRLAPEGGFGGLRGALAEMVGLSGLRAAYCAMVCARGRPLVPGNRDPRACRSHLFAWCVPYVHVFGADAAGRGVHLHVAEGVRRIPSDSVDQRAKNYHWGDFTAGLFEAKDAGAENVLLLDAAGCVTEGPGFNVFAVSGGGLATPAEHCLEGITRRTVLELAAGAGIPAEVRAVPLGELMEADEVFVTTSGGGVIPVVRIGDRVFSNGAEGPVTGRLRAGYWARVADPAWRTPVPYG